MRPFFVIKFIVYHRYYTLKYLLLFQFNLLKETNLKMDWTKWIHQRELSCDIKNTGRFNRLFNLIKTMALMV